MKFADLIAVVNELPPRKSYDRAAEKFPEAVRSSLFHLYRLGDPVCKTGYRILYGACTYVPATLTFLYQLNNYLLERPVASLQIDVFNIEDCRSPSDLERYIAGTPVSIPVAGLWIDGVCAIRVASSMANGKVFEWVEMARAVSAI